MKILARRLLIVTMTLVAWTAAGQQRRQLEPSEYGRWEQLAAQRTPLSPDGQWLVYGITRSNRQNELRVHAVGGGSPTIIPFGELPSFSDDSRWLAYLVGFSEEQEAKLRKDKKPLHKSLGLLELSSGKTTTVAGVESFSFSPTGTHLAMRRYAPESRDSSAPAASPAPTETVGPGTTLVVRELATTRDLTFGSVSELAWQDRGTLLALAITVDGGIGNGVQLLDTATGSLKVLDSSASTYSGLVWRKDSAALAVLRSHADEGHEGPSHAALLWPDLVKSPDASRTFDPTAGSNLPGISVSFASVRRAGPTTAPSCSLASLPGLAKPPRASRTGLRVALPRPATSPTSSPTFRFGIPSDPVVMARQKIDARRERERSMLAAWRLSDGRLVRIAESLSEEATPIPRSARALIIDTTPFAMERSIGRVYANVWTIDLQIGRENESGGPSRGSLRAGQPRRPLPALREKRSLLDDGLATGRHVNITRVGQRRRSSIASQMPPATRSRPLASAGWSRDDNPSCSTTSSISGSSRPTGRTRSA